MEMSIEVVDLMDPMLLTTEAKCIVTLKTNTGVLVIPTESETQMEQTLTALGYDCTEMRTIYLT